MPPPLRNSRLGNTYRWGQQPSNSIGGHFTDADGKHRRGSPAGIKTQARERADGVNPLRASAQVTPGLYGKLSL